MAAESKISFQGIVRMSDADSALPGECSELINAQSEGGALRVVPPPALLHTFPVELGAFYLHKSANCYLALSADGNRRLYIYDSGFNPVTMDAVLTGIDRMEFVNYIVVLFTADGLRYMRYDNGSYRYLGSRPPLPQLLVGYDTKQQCTITDEKYNNLFKEGVDASLYWKNAAKGFFDQCIQALNKEGYFIDCILVRFALRLFDGRYAYHSPVYYVSYLPQATHFGSWPYSYSSSGRTDNDFSDRFVAAVCGFKPQFNLTVDSELEKWEDLIVSVDLFVTPSIMRQKVELEGNVSSRVVYSSRDDSRSVSPSTLFERYEAKEPTEFWNDVAEAHLFYKVAEYNLKGELKKELTEVGSDSLSASLSLPDDNGSHNELSAECSYVYNGRLHLGDVGTRFFCGYGADALLPAGSGWPTTGRVVSADQYVVLKTAYGSTIVTRHFSDGNFFPASEISPYLSYPDYRATRIILRYQKSDGISHWADYELTPHRYLNLALYINAGKKFVVSLAYSRNGARANCNSADFLKAVDYQEGSYRFTYTQGAWHYDGEETALDSFGITYITRGSAIEVPVEEESITVTVAKSSGVSTDIENIDMAAWGTGAASIDSALLDRRIRQTNRLQVSALDNPFYFDPALSYSVSGGSIVAIGSNTTALSQGQFGQHPLYLFCDEGIWSMGVDSSGSTVYSHTVPLARDVCRSAASVCSTDRGVAFVNDRGVMLMQGAEAQLLSLALCCESEEPAAALCRIVCGGTGYSRSVADDCRSGDRRYFAWKSGAAALRYTRSLAPKAGDAVYSSPGSGQQSGSVSAYEEEPLQLPAKIGTTAGLLACMQPDRFSDYCTEATVGYDYARQLIMVANESYPYLYCFNLATGNWFKQSVSLRAFANSYPQAWAIAVEAGTTRLLQMDNRAHSFNRFCAVSRPLLMESEARKQVTEAALRGFLSSSQRVVSLAAALPAGHPLRAFADEPRFGCQHFYLLGSNDGVHFVLLGGGEGLSGSRGSVCRRLSVAAFRYVAVAVAGWAADDNRITGVHLLMRERWNNKIR